MIDFMLYEFHLNLEKVAESLQKGLEVADTVAYMHQDTK